MGIRTACLWEFSLRYIIQVSSVNFEFGLQILLSGPASELHRGCGWLHACVAGLYHLFPYLEYGICFLTWNLEAILFWIHGCFSCTLIGYWLFEVREIRDVEVRSVRNRMFWLVDGICEQRVQTLWWFERLKFFWPWYDMSDSFCCFGF
jgi:hypothetical protein